MCFDYAKDYDFDSEQTEDLWYHIRLMDIEFLEFWKKKQPKPKTPRAPRGKRSS